MDAFSQRGLKPSYLGIGGLTPKRVDVAMEQDSGPPSKFSMWLAEHQSEVEDGAASYEGVLVTRSSPVARYFCCTSILFSFAYQISSCVLEGTSEASKVRLRSTLVTLVFGCFGLGIFLVPYYLIRNITGGYRMTVGDLLDNSEKLQKSNDAFEFGPVHAIFAVLLIFVVAAIALQIAIAVKKMGGH